MKTFTFVAILLCVGGCAWLGKQYDYVSLCANDPACLSQAKKDSETVKAVAGAAFPIAAIPAGALGMTLALWLRGRKKK